MIRAFKLVIISLSVLIFSTLVFAEPREHRHDEHHDAYKEWINRDGKGCCNDQDCARLDEVNDRSSRGFREVRVEGVWCPVLEHHYLKKGANVPNALYSHACVLHPYAGDLRTTCERFICYQPRPEM